jgi:hypothetical protein
MDVLSLGDYIGHRAATAAPDFQHAIASFYTQRRDRIRIRLFIVLVEPIGDGEANRTLRISELSGPLGQCESFEDGHVRFLEGLTFLTGRSSAAPLTVGKGSVMFGPVAR